MILVLHILRHDAPPLLPFMPQTICNFPVSAHTPVKHCAKRAVSNPMSGTDSAILALNKLRKINLQMHRRTFERLRSIDRSCWMNGFNIP